MFTRLTDRHEELLPKRFVFEIPTKAVEQPKTGKEAGKEALKKMPLSDLEARNAKAGKDLDASKKKAADAGKKLDKNNPKQKDLGDRIEKKIGSMIRSGVEAIRSFDITKEGAGAKLLGKGAEIYQTITNPLKGMEKAFDNISIKGALKDGGAGIGMLFRHLANLASSLGLGGFMPSLTKFLKGAASSFGKPVESAEEKKAKEDLKKADARRAIESKKAYWKLNGAEVSKVKREPDSDHFILFKENSLVEPKRVNFDASNIQYYRNGKWESGKEDGMNTPAIEYLKSSGEHIRTLADKVAGGENVDSVRAKIAIALMQAQVMDMGHGKRDIAKLIVDNWEQFRKEVAPGTPAKILRNDLTKNPFQIIKAIDQMKEKQMKSPELVAKKKELVSKVGEIKTFMKKRLGMMAATIGGGKGIIDQKGASIIDEINAQTTPEACMKVGEEKLGVLIQFLETEDAKNAFSDANRTEIKKYLAGIKAELSKVEKPTA